MIEGLRVVFLTESLKMSDLEERKVEERKVREKGGGDERLKRKVEGKEGKEEVKKRQRSEDTFSSDRPPVHTPRQPLYSAQLINFCTRLNELNEDEPLASA